MIKGLNLDLIQSFRWYPAALCGRSQARLIEMDFSAICFQFSCEELGRRKKFEAYVPNLDEKMFCNSAFVATRLIVILGRLQQN